MAGLWLVGGVTLVRARWWQNGDDSSGIPKVIANQPELSPDGQMVLPYWKERPAQETCHTAGHATAGVLVADAAGEKWKAYGEISSQGTWLIEGTTLRILCSVFVYCPALPCAALRCPALPCTALH
eukprot:4797818-Pyramimonas_sp.AAC.1